MSISMTGDAGDWSQLFTSSGLDGTFLPFLNGTLIPQLPGLAANLGFLPSGGVLNFEATVPLGLVGPGEAQVLFGQGLFANPEQQIFLGAPSLWVFLDEDHDPDDGC